MKVEFEEISDESRLWIHQINRELDKNEQEELIKRTEAFLEEWTAHGNGLKAAVKIIDGRLLIIAADESYSGASGCSIDSLVAFLRNVQLELGIDLFSRQNIFYQREGKLYEMDLHLFKNKVAENEIPLDTLIYNTTILKKSQMEQDLLQRIEDSWLMRMITVH